MDYKTINECIVNWLDFPPKIKKSEKLYKYMINNRVAYFYSKSISKNNTKIEKEIIKMWDKRNCMLHKTLDEMVKICKKYNIEFLLYKTYKFIDEVIWWDIDIIVKKNDFNKFLDVFEKEWWECEEDEKLKWKCDKKWYLTIEPHVSVSWLGRQYLEEHHLWENPINVNIDWKKYNNVNMNIEIISIYAKILFEPEYLDLYDYIIIKREHKIWYKILSNLIDNTWLWSLKYLIIKFKDKKILNRKLPFFINSFVLFYLNLFFFFKTWKVNSRVFIHNFYWKRRYKFKNILPFLTKYIKIWKL